MACRLFGTKPLPEPMKTYYQYDLEEHKSVKSQPKHEYFPPPKCVFEKYRLQMLTFFQASILKATDLRVIIEPTWL